VNLQDKACEILRLLGEIHEMEETVSRLKNELMDEWHKVDDALDGAELNTFSENPVIKEMQSQ
jgi:hypothetical protein